MPLTNNPSVRFERQSYITAFKLAVQHANKLVKEHPDLRGRVKVKVHIANFENKCDYYVEQLGLAREQRDRPVLTALDSNSRTMDEKEIERRKRRRITDDDANDDDDDDQ